jgi:tripartite-type tricarboxylate transporter receptor subunit TctC
MEVFMKKISVFLTYRFIVIASLFLTLAFINPCPIRTWGSEYPERPITVVVPYPPGALDQEAWVFAPEIKKTLGQNVLIENRPGGGSSIGAQYVAQARTDGYIIMFTAGSTLSLNPNVVNLPYKLGDFIPIAQTSYVPLILAAGVNTPWRTVGEFVDYAKKNPDVIKYGSVGTGTALHICGEAMAEAAGIKLIHVPFKGLSESIAATIGGHIDCLFGMPQGVLPQVKGGKLRALALCSPQRYENLPDVPTLKEAGIPMDFRAGVNTLGFFVPKGTPHPICDKLTETVRKIMADPNTIANMKKIGSLPEFLDQKEFRSFLEKQSALIKELVEKLGLKK